MKTDKRLSFTLSDAGADARTTFGRFFHGIAGMVDASTDFLVSIVVNVIGFLGSLIGEILTRLVKAPLVATMLGLMGGGAYLGLDHIGYAKHKLYFDGPGFLEDLSKIAGAVKSRVTNLDLSKLPLPHIDFSKVIKEDPGLVEARKVVKETIGAHHPIRPQPSRYSWFQRGTQTAQTVPRQSGVPAGYFEGEQAPIYSVPSAYQQPAPGRVYPVQPEVAPSSVDRLGAFINQQTFVNHQALSNRFRVAQNAYRTAKIHGLSFRPGTNIDATLRNCRWLSEGAYIRFVLNDQGYVIGCHVTR